MHRAEYFACALPVRAHILEAFAIALNSTEILVDPHDDIPFRGAFSKALESVQSIKKGLATRDNGVHVKPLAGALQNINGAVFENVAPERDKSGSTVVHDEGSILG